ncbi:WD domain, G-beta repeat [Streptomyces acidiscabies]|nr:WD domain, G-beta repeat [Streptomyces acidiscabies]GAV45976.1 WD domain, G-beta repeat [Streptomyces acidiscabies]
MRCFQGLGILLLTGYNSAIDGVVFAPDGHALALTGADHTVQLWDVARRSLRARLTGHTQPVMAVTFSADGHTLAFAGMDRSVILWTTDPRHTTALTCQAVARNLTPAQWKEFLPEIPYHQTCDNT